MSHVLIDASAETPVRYTRTELPPKIQWDKFQRFHIYHQNRRSLDVVEYLDSGERVVRVYKNIEPSDRCRYPREAFTLWGSADEPLPALTLPDGTLVRRTWLNDTGSQILLLDHRHGIAVKATPSEQWTKHPTPPPPKLRWGSVYYPDAKAAPIAAGKISLTRPTEWTLEQKRDVRTLRDVCRAWVAMHPEISHIREDEDTVTATLTGALAEQQRSEDPKGQYRTVSFIDPEATRAIRLVKPSMLMETLTGRAFEALTVIERFIVAYGTVAAGVTTTWHTHLTWTPDTTFRA